MLCPNCKTRIRVCPNTAPGEWARAALALWGTGIGLAIVALAMTQWSLFCFAGVAGMGAGYATLATVNSRAWASGFHGSRCPNCGHEYEVGFWTLND